MLKIEVVEWDVLSIYRLNDFLLHGAVIQIIRERFFFGK